MIHEPLPEAWLALAMWIGIPRELTVKLWQALKASRWTRACELRSAVLLHQAVPLSPRGLTEHSCTPAKLIDVVEDLATQHLLSNSERVAIEETVLLCTNKHGYWKTRQEKETVWPGRSLVCSTNRSIATVA